MFLVASPKVAFGRNDSRSIRTTSRTKKKIINKSRKTKTKATTRKKKKKRKTKVNPVKTPQPTRGNSQKKKTGQVKRGAAVAADRLTARNDLWTPESPQDVGSRARSMRLQCCFVPLKRSTRNEPIYFLLIIL